LADSSSNDHLWTQYADNYAGVSLEFFVNPTLGSAFEVIYTDAVSALDITDDESIDSLIQTALVKRTEWAPEREYRLVLSEPPIKGDPPLVQQRLQFGEELLTGLIFGDHVDPDQRESLINQNRFRTSQLRFYKARKTPEGNVLVGEMRT